MPRQRSRFSCYEYSVLEELYAYKEKRSLNAHIFALDACTSLVSAIFKSDVNTEVNVYILL